MTQPAPPPNLSDSPVFELNLKDITAKAQYQNGQFVVLRGSFATSKFNNHLDELYRQRHASLVAQSQLIPSKTSDLLVFTANVDFDSPSRAATLILGGNTNGHVAWKHVLPNGQEQILDEWLKQIELDQQEQEDALLSTFPYEQFCEDVDLHRTDLVKGNILLDQSYARPLLEWLEEQEFQHLQPHHAQYNGKNQMAAALGLHHKEADSKGLSGRLMLFDKEGGFEDIEIPAGLTNEIRFSEEQTKFVRKALTEPQQREALIDTLFQTDYRPAPVLTWHTQDQGFVQIQLTSEQRPRLIKELAQYAQTIESSRLFGLMINLPPQQLESEDFVDSLEQMLLYTDQVMGSFSELTDPEDNATTSKPKPPVQKPLNQILYGPPGTGKTYEIINRTLEILDPEFVSTNPDRNALKNRYDELTAAGQITFVTFHQTLGYEDFVEGLKPVVAGGQINYEIEDGLFLRAVKAAGHPLEGKTISNEPQSFFGPHAQTWYACIDGITPTSQMREHCLQNGELRIGHWLDEQAASVVNLSFLNDKQLQGRQVLFREGLRTGDLVLLGAHSDQIQAVGIVESEYQYDHSQTQFSDSFAHMRRINWLKQDLKIPISDITHKRPHSAGLQRLPISPQQISQKLDLFPQNSDPSSGSSHVRPHVMIIDEINRGNVAKVFGELITLLEPSKRLGAAEGLQVRLPLSKRVFGVPDNLYVIGTMNTADRSLTQLDTALRRRFHFYSIRPKPELLAELHTDEGILDLGQCLQVINRRIERLLSQEQMIGHAYFLDIQTLEHLAEMMQQRLLPLLEEYFYEDWAQIRQVLGDDQKPKEFQFIHEVTKENHQHFTYNQKAFSNVESYIRIYAGVNDLSNPL